MDDRIVKVVELKAPLAKVWAAISDHRKFGTWFRVALDQPFEAGKQSTGKMTYPGHEGTPWLARVEAVEPERRLAFRWPAHEEGSDINLADAPTTLVEFVLEPVSGGTRVTITESGLDKLSDKLRLEVLRNNTEGWNIQAKNLAEYVE